jgi:hypothetical protein
MIPIAKAPFLKPWCRSEINQTARSITPEMRSSRANFGHFGSIGRREMMDRRKHNWSYESEAGAVAVILKNGRRGVHVVLAEMACG